MNKLIIRISNELGNQMFMYASSLSIAKKLNRDLYVDDLSAYLLKKNISNYGLNNFNISSSIADKNDKFIGNYGYIKRKIFKILNKFLYKKIFFIEKKDKKKITRFSKEILNLNLSKKVFMEGYFESEKYFENIKNEIIKEFKFVNNAEFKKSIFYNMINRENTVSICLRQNRFIEGKNKKLDNKNYIKSEKFKLEQIKYINKSIEYLKRKIDNPTFFLWSNEIEKINKNQFNTKLNFVVHEHFFCKNLDKRALDLFLISQCNHHIVIPSSFNWWGAWLSQKNNKIICRPSENFFSDFKVNNIDFWPKNWIRINE